MRQGCPSCGASLHYSSGWNESLCNECYWIEGDVYTPYIVPISWSEYQVIIPLILAQVRMRKIKYEEFVHMIDNEIRLKSIP